MDIPHKNFLMLMPGRTGSTYVIEKMDHHPMIHAAGEILDKHRSEPDEDRRLSKQLALTKSFFSQTCSVDTKWVGFKTKLYPGEWTEKGLDRFYETLVDAAIEQVVLLLRANIVKQAFSFCRAENLHKVSNVWNVSNESQVVGIGDIDPDQFQKQMDLAKAQNDAVINFSQRFDCPTEIMHYEDLLKDEAKFFRRIYDVFDVPQLETHSITRKHTPDDLRKSIGNFVELRNGCVDPSMRLMFDEVLPARDASTPIGGKRILVAVMTTQGAIERQQAISRTWAKLLPNDTEIVFFAGGASELKRAGKKLLLSCSDTDDAEKMQAFLEYAVQHYQFDYVFKCNDDCYVNVQRLVDCGYRQYDYYGNPPSGSQWDKAPYADTNAYFLSRRCAQLVADSDIGEPVVKEHERGHSEGILIGDILRQSQISLVVNQHFSVVPGVLSSENCQTISYPEITPRQMKNTYSQHHSLSRRLLGKLRQLRNKISG